MMVEKWVPVRSNPAYMVSNFGRVKNNKFYPPKILKYEIDMYGKIRYKLFDESKGKFFNITRIVWESFNGPTDKVISHIDHNPNNNRLSNLTAIDTKSLATKYYWLNNSKKYSIKMIHIATGKETVFDNVSTASKKSKVPINGIMRCIEGFDGSIKGYKFVKIKKS